MTQSCVENWLLTTFSTAATSSDSFGPFQGHPQIPGSAGDR